MITRLSVGASLLMGLCLIACEARAQTQAQAQEEDCCEDDSRVAARKALPWITRAGSGYVEQRDCFSCHHQAMSVLAWTTAGKAGMGQFSEMVREQAEFTESSLFAAIDAYRAGKGEGGGVTRAGYALWTLEMAGWTPDATTEAVVEFLLKRDEKLPYWKSSSKRPPSEASDFTTTFLALRGIQAFGMAEQKRRAEAKLERCRAWLRDTSPRSGEVEDHVFRLWAMKLARVDETSLGAAADKLKQLQHKDGGWSQLADQPSDAYATATALMVLGQVLPTSRKEPFHQRGTVALRSMQLGDGTWKVASRSKPFQTYFESGFPHGKDQFISMAATSWAIAALCQEQGTVKSP